MKFSIEKKFSFSLLFIYLLTLVFFATASAGRLVVSPEGGKFESVEKAVSAAEPGDTVFIESGTFKGGLKIEKDLTLKGAGKQKVRIQGSEKGEPVLLVGPSTASVTVRNLTLRDARGELCEDLNRELCPSGVSLVGKAQVKLRDVIIRSNKKDGLSLIDSSRASVKDAEIKGNGRYGVRLSDSSRIEIKGGKFRENWINVALYKNATGKINGSEISTATRGISLYGQTGIVIEKTEIFGHNQDAIRLFKSSRASIDSSSIKSNAGRGVLIQDSATLSLEGSELNKNAVGITNHSDGSVEFRNNKITGNAVDLVGNLDGELREKQEKPKAKKISLPDADYSELQEAVDALEPGGEIILEGKVKGGAVVSKEVTIKSSGKDAGLYFPKETDAPVLSLVGQADLRLNGITVTGSGSSGIAAGSNGMLRVKGSVVNSSGEGGIELWDSASLLLKDSEVSGNEGNGIRLVDSTRLVVRDGVFSDNKRMGFILGGVSRGTIKDSKISGSGGHGLAMFGSASVVLEGVTVSGSGSNGVKLTGTARAFLENCGIVKNEWDGIALYSPSWLTLKDSKVANNSNGFSLRDDSWLFAQDNSIQNNDVGIKVMKPQEFKGEIGGSGNAVIDNGTDFAGMRPGVRKELVG